MIDAAGAFQLPLLDLERAARRRRGAKGALYQQIRDRSQNRDLILHSASVVPGARCWRSCDEKEHVLQLTVHHIISDGWSQGVMLRELSVHCTERSFAKVCPRRSRLPAYPVCRLCAVVAARLAAG